jgi:hypothetical protein
MMKAQTFVKPFGDARRRCDWDAIHQCEVRFIDAIHDVQFHFLKLVKHPIGASKVAMLVGLLEWSIAVVSKQTFTLELKVRNFVLGATNRGEWAALTPEGCW